MNDTTTAHLRESVLRHEYTEALAAVVADEQAIARAEAARVSHLARAAELGDLLAERSAAVEGRRCTAVDREWARRSLAAELCCLSRRSERTVARLVNEAESLVAILPATVDALAQGSISYLHVRALLSHARTLPSDAVCEFEVAVLPDAEALTPARFDERARRLREHLHPESIAERSRQAHDDRGVWLDAERDGMATLHHHLAAVDALAIHDLLDRTARSLRAPDEPRTQLQLRSDVFRDLLLDPAPCGATAPGGAPASPSPTHTVDSASPSRFPSRPHAIDSRPTARRPRITPTVIVTIPADTLHRGALTPAGRPHRSADAQAGLPHRGATIPADTLHRGARTPAGRPHSGGVHTVDDMLHRRSDASDYTPHHDADAPADLLGYGPIHGSAARRLAAGASSVFELVYDPATGAPLSFGRTRYSPPAALRALLQHDDRTCRFPGCSRSADRCELDHTLAWEDGGTTDPTNLAHLCSRHHHLKHSRGWSVTQDPSGSRTLTWSTPTGSHHTTTPQGRPAEPRPSPSRPPVASSSPPPPTVTSCPSGQSAASSPPWPAADSSPSRLDRSHSALMPLAAERSQTEHTASSQSEQRRPTASAMFARPDARTASTAHPPRHGTADSLRARSSHARVAFGPVPDPTTDSETPSLHAGARGILAE
ncbi:DUF222 domain-containing protein [Herbiconiux sp. A18JL235]|uniref:DUF222 domain-containing protein n=1 Tax=Herbiconiux sp. A18JL235 TaxID=3152363 RepID=A0AB39BL05_9MICO